MSEKSKTRLVRLKEVVEMRGEKTRNAIYNAMREGTFTKPIKMTGRSVAWLLEEVETLVRARGCGATDGQLRELVTRLHAERDAKLAALMTEGV